MNLSSVNENRRPVILAFTACYLPGYKAGGPIHSVANLAQALKGEFDFRVVTSDRDARDRVAYSGVRGNAWQELNGVRVCYLSPGPQRWWRIVRILLEGEFDLIYLNSFFSRPFSMLPILLRRSGVVRRVPILLAPRGEVSLGALEIKKCRKRTYIALGRLLRIYASVSMHAASKLERADIVRALTLDARNSVAKPRNLVQIFVAPQIVVTDLSDPSNTSAARPPKISGTLNVVFVSRICKKKNLTMALQVLAAAQGDVKFNIFGPIEDAHYWKQCLLLIRKLPPNVQAKYHGDLRHGQVPWVFRTHHLLFFPTFSESFGHVIVEALVNGCPVLLSNQTPWRQLREKGVGWDLPLDQVAPFQQAVQKCVDMDAVEFQEFSKCASLFGMRALSSPGVIAQNREMFRSMLALK